MPSTTNQNLPESTTGEPFLPGEVLVKIRVYPGAVGTTLFIPGFWPPSFPLGIQIYGSKLRGYQSASAQYTVQATMIDIDGWYRGQLATMGYRESGEEGGQKGTLSSRSISYFLLSQPLVSVQVNIFTSENDSGSSVFELMIVYTVPLPKPSEEILPTDIDSVQIDYAPGTPNEKTMTINDKKAVQSLVNMINGLPVRPDYFYSGGPVPLPGETPGPKTLFSLSFHSASAGNVMVTDILGGNDTGIHMGDYPILEDTHWLLKEAIENILGISNT